MVFVSFLKYMIPKGFLKFLFKTTILTFKLVYPEEDYTVYLLISF